ncbi:MAG: oligosaccharide flippase family protein [Pseudomonadota bacterium]
MATALYHLIGPIFSALFPKFSQLVALNDTQELTALYHRASQLMSVVILPVVLVLAMFSYQVMLLWTGDPIIAAPQRLITQPREIMERKNQRLDFRSYF